MRPGTANAGLIPKSGMVSAPPIKATGIPQGMNKAPPRVPSGIAQAPPAKSKPKPKVGAPKPKASDQATPEENMDRNAMADINARTSPGVTALPTLDDPTGTAYE